MEFLFKLLKIFKKRVAIGWIAAVYEDAESSAASVLIVAVFKNILLELCISQIS